MNIIDRLNNSYKIVCENSKDVKINYQKIDEMLPQIEKGSASHWLETNPYNLMEMDTKNIINFLLIYHTVGDYCFWGEPKWEIQIDSGKIDGSYAIMYLLLNRYKENNDFEMSYKEFENLLKGNVEIPLLKDRYNNLVKMNKFIKDSGKSFYELIKDYYRDTDLFEFIVNHLNYYKDISKYNGKEILFYKRAQLLTSDILHVLEKKEKIKVDYSHLIGCADYKIPQVMRCYGMIEFSNSLAEKVDNKIELEKDSEEEIEIRANTLKVIEYIYEKLDKKYSRMNINDFIWLLGQDKSKINKPYHRTLTNCY